MPKAYLKMKRKFRKEGLSDKAAKGKAARIYNSKHPDAPVTKDYDEKHRSQRSAEGNKGAGIRDLVRK